MFWRKVGASTRERAMAAKYDARERQFMRRVRMMVLLLHPVKAVLGSCSGLVFSLPRRLACILMSLVTPVHGLFVVSAAVQCGQGTKWHRTRTPGMRDTERLRLLFISARSSLVSGRSYLSSFTLAVGHPLKIHSALHISR